MHRLIRSIALLAIVVSARATQADASVTPIRACYDEQFFSYEWCIDAANRACYNEYCDGSPLCNWMGNGCSSSISYGITSWCTRSGCEYYDE